MVRGMILGVVLTGSVLIWSGYVSWSYIDQVAYCEGEIQELGETIMECMEAVRECDEALKACVPPVDPSYDDDEDVKYEI
jgi:hypothetical protein